MSSICVSSSPFIAPAASNFGSDEANDTDAAVTAAGATVLAPGRALEHERPHEHADRFPVARDLRARDIAARRQRLRRHDAARHAPRRLPARHELRRQRRQRRRVLVVGDLERHLRAGSTWRSALEYSSRYAASRSSSDVRLDLGAQALPRRRQVADDQIAHGQRLARHLPRVHVAHDAAAPALGVDDTEAQRVDARLERRRR